MGRAAALTAEASMPSVAERLARHVVESDDAMLPHAAVAALVALAGA